MKQRKLNVTFYSCFMTVFFLRSDEITRNNFFSEIPFGFPNRNFESIKSIKGAAARKKENNKTQCCCQRLH